MDTQSRCTISRRQLMQAAGGALAGWSLLSGLEAASGNSLPSPTPRFGMNPARVALVFAVPEGQVGKAARNTGEWTSTLKLILSTACPRIEFESLNARTREDARALADRADAYDGIVVWMGGGHREIPAVLARTGKPIVLACPPGTEPPALPASVVTVDSADMPEVTRAVLPFYAIRAMKETTVLAITEVDNSSEAARVEQLFGTRVARIGGTEVRDLYRSIPEQDAAEWAGRWKSGAAHIDGGAGAGLVSSGRLYLAVCKAMAEHGANMVAADCQTVKRADASIPYFCLSHTQMNNDGVAAVCSADLSLACASAMGRCLATRPTFLTLARGSTTRGELILMQNACFNRPYGPTREPSPYELTDETPQSGVYIRSLLPKDRPVTMIALDLAGGRMGAYGAETRGRMDRVDTCRTALAVKPVDGVVPQGPQGSVAVFGDFEREARYLCRLLGMRPIAARKLA